MRTMFKPFLVWRSQGSPEQRANRWLKAHWTGCKLAGIAVLIVSVAALAALTIR